MTNHGKEYLEQTGLETLFPLEDGSKNRGRIILICALPCLLFLPVTPAAVGSYVLVVHPSLPVKSVQELIAVARAGTASHIVGRLHGEIERIVRMPEVRERLLGLGTEPFTSPPAESSAFIKAEVEKVSATS